MGTAAGFQSKILGFTFLTPRGVRQVVNGVPISSDEGERRIKRPHSRIPSHRNMVPVGLEPTECWLAGAGGNLSFVRHGASRLHLVSRSSRLPRAPGLSFRVDD